MSWNAGRCPSLAPPPSWTAKASCTPPTSEPGRAPMRHRPQSASRALSVLAVLLVGCSTAAPANPTAAPAGQAAPAATSAPAQTGGGDTGDIVIGASLPLSGPLAPFGPLMQIR